MAEKEGRAVVFLDNGYFSKILEDDFGRPKVDYLKFSETVCGDFHRLRTYVYDCLPYQSNPPKDEEKRIYASKLRFFTALEKLSSFEVRFGKLRPRPGGMVQKGVDILLAVDLVRLSSKGQIQKAFLIAGDADFVPVVKAAKDDGVSVTLYYSDKPQVVDGKNFPKYSNELWGACDERVVIDRDLVDSCLFSGR